MLGGLPTRRYPCALRPAGTAVEAGAKSKTKSAVSRRFAAEIETAVAQLLAADLPMLDLVAVMIDGCIWRALLCGAPGSVSMGPSTR